MVSKKQKALPTDIDERNKYGIPYCYAKMLAKINKIKMERRKIDRHLLPNSLATNLNNLLLRMVLFKVWLIALF